MVGQVDHGILVRYGAVADGERVFAVPGKGDAQFHLAGEAFLHVRRHIGEGDRVLVWALACFGVKKPFVKAFFAAVQGVGAVVDEKRIGFAVQREPSFGDAVGKAAHRGAQTAAFYGVAFGTVKAQAHVGEAAEAVGHADADQVGAVIGHRGAGAGGIGHGIQVCVPSVGRFAEKLLCDAHCIPLLMASSIIAWVALTPQRSAPFLCIRSTVSRSRIPPEAFTRTFGDTAARIRAMSSAVAPALP